MEALLIDAKLDIDIVVINEDQQKGDKFGFTCLFTGVFWMPGYNPRVDITTAAGNTGIDKKTIEMVFRMGIPWDVLTSFQECGRNARQPGTTGAYSITTNWMWFVKLLLSVLIPLRSNSNEPTEYQWVSTSFSFVGSRNQQSEEAPLGETENIKQCCSCI